MNRIKLKYPIFVEGAYDKNRVAAVADGTIVVGDGFGVFNAEEKLALLRRITEETKLIMLTDSDKAGQFIRNKLKGRLNADNIINLYTPALPGKEKRKKTPSKAGILGVEGMSDQVLYDLLAPYSADNSRTMGEEVSPADMYAAALTGKDESASMRKRFCEKAGLPPTLTPKALREAINILGGKDFFYRILEETE